MEQYFSEQSGKKKYFMVEKDIIENPDGSKNMKIEVHGTEFVEELVNDYEYVRQSGPMPVLRKKEST